MFMLSKNANLPHLDRLKLNIKGVTFWSTTESRVSMEILIIIIDPNQK